MKVRILGADSMGVRSLATLIDCNGVLIGIDLGASLAPVRFGLPPHELEFRRLEETLDLIRRALAESQITVITHYHYDHYMRDEIELYFGKTLIVKDPHRDINFSQRIRSYRFLKKSGLIHKAKVELGDGRTFSIEKDLTIEVSPPVWHGETESAVGKVLMVKILCNDTVAIFASDTQGPVDDKALRTLLDWSESRVKFLIMGGPATYLEGLKIKKKASEKGLDNLFRLIETAKPETLIVDHHLLRDENYRTYLERHIQAASQHKVRLVTAAEHEGRPIEQLEAKRRELWRRDIEDLDSYS
ncbi:MAG: hypothetical protein QXN05_00335 [Acidilobaceae archaeon]